MLVYLEGIVHQHLDVGVAALAPGLDALVYQFGDRILLTDDIPGNKTVSSLVVDMSTDGGQTTFSVTEPLDWSFDNPRAIVRYQDGSASGLLVVTRVGDYELSVPWQASFDDIVLEDPYIEPPRLIFCNSTRSYYDAIFDEIGSPSEGTCSITARQYSEIFYQYDDATYPGDAA